MINVKLFQATEYPLEIYNGKALINLAMRFFTTDCDGNDDDFDFPDFESAYFRVHNERLGRQILSLVPSHSGSYLVLNETAETMTFEDNGKALINLAMRFFTTDCDGNDDDFDFPDFQSAYFRVHNERLGRQILSLAPSHSGSYLVLNETAETMTFEDNGKYYYEIGYLRSGGYEQALRFGPLKVI